MSSESFAGLVVISLLSIAYVSVLLWRVEAARKATDALDESYLHHGADKTFEERRRLVNYRRAIRGRKLL